MKKEIEICENCIHFIRHYVKCLTKFKKLYLGHCRKRRFKQTQIDNSCSQFMKKDEAAENERRALKIACYMKSISKELHEIKQVLKDT